jgi:hypothetical protein
MDLNHLVIEICKRIPPDQQYLIKELSLSSMALMKYLVMYYGTRDVNISQQAGSNAQAAQAKTMNALVITHQYGWLSDEEISAARKIYLKINTTM